MRAAIALFFAIALALAAFEFGAGGPASLAIVAVGVFAVIMMSAFNDPAPLQPRAADVQTESGEADIIAATSEPMLLVVDGRVRIANEASRRLLGQHVLSEDVRLAIRHPAAAEQLALDAADGHVELTGIGGRDNRHEMHVATIRPGTRLIHLIDRTARHAVEQARVDFVANASHELRTPLSAILGFIETLSDENAGADPDTRARFLSVMDNEARRMQRLIDDLISLSRIEAEKYALPETRVALPGLVRRVAEEVRVGHESTPPLTLDIDDATPDIIGDDAQLSQLVHNLVGNAIKYGRPGAPVTVTLRPEGNQARLIVSDQGEGIAAEHIPRLTERFYRVDAGRSRGLGGTGLGLAIVKHIVERHRGRLEIASILGAGTTVTVTMPPPPVATVTEASSN